MGEPRLSTLLLDTHVWAWSLTDDSRISKRAREAIAEADTVLVSAISFFETAQKVRLGKWPQMAPYVDQMPALLEAQRGIAVSLDAADCMMAGTMDWAHRDPFDRLLAASALRRRISIVSADSAFDTVLARIW